MVVVACVGEVDGSPLVGLIGVASIVVIPGAGCTKGAKCLVSLSFPLGSGSYKITPPDTGVNVDAKFEATA